VEVRCRWNDVEAWKYGGLEASYRRNERGGIVAAGNVTTRAFLVEGR